jgi:hypothetical protein
MTLEQIARLYVIFKTLQPEIKEWIASDDTSAIVKAIAARFILSDEQERALPLLILRLVTQDLPPESFKAELAKETGVDAELAKSITEAIAKEVIEPIASALRFGGVNTSLLGFNAPASPTEVAPATPTPIPIPDPQPVTLKPENEVSPTDTTPTKPFILHEEPRATVNAAPDGGRSFNYPASSGSIGNSPPRVVIERVVHYSQLRTPLNVASTNKNIPSGDRAKPKLPQSKWFT